MDEKHFLAEFVSGPQEFKAEPLYIPEGDCLIFKSANEAVVGDRIDGVLTILRSAVDNRAIGFQVKDVYAIISKFGLDGIRVDSLSLGDTLEYVKISEILLAAWDLGGPKTIARKRAYSDLMGRSVCGAEVAMSRPRFTVTDEASAQ